MPGGNAEKSGLVDVGDLLLACTGVKVIGAKFDRPLIQVDVLDYDTIMMCIGSNEKKRGMDGPILQFLQEGAPFPDDYISGKMRKTASPLDPSK